MPLSTEMKCNSISVTFNYSSMYVNGPLFAFLSTLSLGAGMVAFAFFASKGCDPLEAGVLPNANQVIKIHVIHQ